MICLYQYLLLFLAAGPLAPHRVNLCLQALG